MKTTKGTKRLSYDELTDTILNRMYQGARDERVKGKAIEMGERFNALRERTGISAKASKQTYQNYVLGYYLSVSEVTA